MLLLFQGSQQPLFLRHEGYLGAIGAFLKGAAEDGMMHLIIIACLFDFSSSVLFILFLTSCDFSKKGVQVSYRPFFINGGRFIISVSPTNLNFEVKILLNFEHTNEDSKAYFHVIYHSPFMKRVKGRLPFKKFTKKLPSL